MRKTTATLLLASSLVFMFGCTPNNNTEDETTADTTITIPNNITTEFLDSKRLDYNARTRQIQQSVKFMDKMNNGEDRRRILEETITSSRTCVTRAREFNVALEEASGDVSQGYSNLDPEKCVENLPINTDEINQGETQEEETESSEFSSMREQIANELRMAQTAEDGLERQSHIIKANSLINTCRQYAERESVDEKLCVPEDL